MPLIDPALLEAMPGLPVGHFAIIALDACDSTSSEVMRRADQGAPAGTVVVADRQTAGRGRRGRTWLSAPAASLTFSLLWRFSGPPGRLSGLSLAVGVALAKGLESLGARGVRLKWPNDVLLAAAADFAKLAGILVELATDRLGTQAVIGIGVNLQAPGEDLQQPATGLDQALMPLPDRHLVLAAILRELGLVLEAFAVDGFSGAKIDWQQRHAWQGLAVRLVADDGTALDGICEGVDDDGALLLATAAGVQRIFSGDVSLRRAGSALGVRRA
jgi:BirA family biotin operon repressor/biotin-[acetyl-CoA-carboxylase] ligase